ncbi:MAG TPA: D-2-hydroxyacid dehydrogenase [Vicinamibacterales bacterium]|nr:D-2-hydroxyacid dehydrogenase [Vicinamibacterales bacterium]
MIILIGIHSAFAMWNIPAGQVLRLRRDFPEHTFIQASSDDECRERIGAAEVAFMGHVTRPQLAAAARLRWIHSPAAGISGMLFPEMIASPIVLTNSRGMSADTIAEHVLAVTLAMFRRLPEAFRYQSAKVWAQDAISLAGNRALAGSRIVIVGLGSIGRAVAQRMTALGARVTGVRRNPGADTDAVERVVGAEVLREVLNDADVVVVSAPHTRDTRSLIGAAELAAMPPHALLVNVSRGPLVDEPALVQALRSHAIAGAALDVFNDEPLPPDSPFWTLPNVLITPHTSGLRADHWDAAVALFSDNLRRFVSGQPLLNVVDKKAGY